MTIFSITPDNNITAHATLAEAKSIPEAEQFASAKALGKLAAKWPSPRLIEIWNSLPGQRPVKRFKDRNTAASRIWSAIQSLQHDAPGAAGAAKKARSGRRAAERAEAGTPRTDSKTAQVLGLLKQPGGATLNEIMAATSWQAHSVRGFVSGTLGKKMGLTVTSAKRDDGERVYSIS